MKFSIKDFLSTCDQIRWKLVTFTEEIFRAFPKNCAFPQNFHTKKSCEITAFYTVTIA